MNKSKITKINLHASNGQKPPVPPNPPTNLSNLPGCSSSNPLSTIPMSSKSIEFERYEFTTPMNTMELKKCKDLNSISSNDYSIEFANNKLAAGKFKGGRDNKKCFLSSNRDTNCNDKSASEFASYTEPSKMPNENAMCLPNSLTTNSSSDASLSDAVHRENGVPNKRPAKGKMMVQRKKVTHNKPKNYLHSSSMLMPSAICSPSKSAWQPPFQCPLGHQKCLAKKQELDYQQGAGNQFKLTDKCEFLFFCIGTSINLGNLWRFPYLCLLHDGGAFLVAYFISCILIGFPLLLIELSLGQYAKMNSIHLFKNLSPIFKGFANVTVMVSLITTIYLNLVLSWTLIYIYESFRGMRFKKCDPAYSSLDCTNLDAIKYNMVNRSSIVLSSEDFFNNQILSKPLAEAQLTKINWTVLLALFVTWSVLFALLSLNVRNTGRLVYFVATFPYFVLFLVFLKCITLNNAVDGLIFYVVPNLNKLKDLELWKDAAVQVFYSFGLVSGTILTYASQNKFYSPVVNHATLVWSINMLTSLFVCFSIFSILGFYASILGRPVNSVLSSGIGLLFIVIPDRLAGSMSWPVLWTCFYFLILFIIGLNTQLASLEVICSFLDNLLGNKRKSRTVLRYFGLCLVLFLFSIPFATRSGAYLMEITDYYFNGLVYLCIALMEFVLVSYIFGISNFFCCLKQMRCWTPRLLVKSHLTVLLTTICPIILLYLINISFQQILNLKEKNIFRYSDRLSEIFGYALWVFLLLNLFLVLFGCFHFIFIQELEKKLISTANHKLSIWIKIRFGLEANSSFSRNATQNAIRSMKEARANKNQPKYLMVNKKHHQANCSLHGFKNKMVKNKDSIIIF